MFCASLQPNLDQQLVSLWGKQILMWFLVKCLVGLWGAATETHQRRAIISCKRENWVSSPSPVAVGWWDLLHGVHQQQSREVGSLLWPLSFKGQWDCYNTHYLNVYFLSFPWVYPETIADLLRSAWDQTISSLCGLKLVGCHVVCESICCTLLSLNWNLIVLCGVFSNFLNLRTTLEHAVFQ